MRRLGAGIGVLLLAVLTGCSDDGPGGRACTAIGSSHGLAVTVAADVAPVRGLVLSVCVDGACEDHAVELEPGTAAGSSSCTGSGPDDSCSAEVTPDGTQAGHVTLELPEGPLEIGGHYRQGGETVELTTATVTAVASYPNGRGCGAEGTQAQVTLDGAGLH